MPFDQLIDPTVRAVFEALNEGDKKAFLGLFKEGATFIHNGADGELSNFFDELFAGPEKASFTEIEKTEDEGRKVYAILISPVIGELHVLMQFKTSGGKITAMNAGRP